MKGNHDGSRARSPAGIHAHGLGRSAPGATAEVTSRRPARSSTASDSAGGTAWIVRTTRPLRMSTTVYAIVALLRDHDERLPVRGVDGHGRRWSAQRQGVQHMSGAVVLSHHEDAPDAPVDRDPMGVTRRDAPLR